MTSILISSDNPSASKEIAMQVSEALGYKYVGEWLMSEVVSESGISLRDLKAVLGLGSRLSTKPKGELLRGFVRLEAALTELLLGDNIVVDGLGGHLHVRGVSHILNVRILSDLRAQAHHLALEERISPRAARKMLERRARQVQRWSLDLFGVDETCPSNYDMMINLGNIDEKRAVTTIVDTAGDRKFQPMTYSRKCLENRALADQVRVRLISDFPSVGIKAEDGLVRLQLAKRWFRWEKTVEILREAVGKVNGVSGVEIYTSAMPNQSPEAELSGV